MRNIKSNYIREKKKDKEYIEHPSIQQIREILKKEGVSEDILEETLEKIKRNDVIYNRMMYIKNVTINTIYFDKIEFNIGSIYGEGIIKPFCFRMPEIYKVNVLGYDPSSTKIFFYARRIEK